MQPRRKSARKCGNGIRSQRAGAVVARTTAVVRSAIRRRSSKAFLSSPSSGWAVEIRSGMRSCAPAGHATGIDMTPTMVARATTASVSHDIRNTSFVLAPIEKLPLPDGHADVVLSNCVINLSPDKRAVFAEAFRILKSGGRLVISDVVQERDLGPIEDDCGCVGNAMVRGEYLETIGHAGFSELRIVEDRPWRTGSGGIEASAVTLIARKPGTEVKM